MSRRAFTGGASAFTVQVIGLSGVQAALKPLLDPELTNGLDKANRKAAQSLNKLLKANVARSSRAVAKTVRVKRARTGKPGWIVSNRRAGIGFVLPMIVGGTRDHGPRTAKALTFVPGWNPYLGASRSGVGNRVVSVKRVRGIKGNDVVEATAQQGEGAAAAVAEAEFVKQAGL